MKGPPMSSETQGGSRKGTDGNGDDGRLTVPPMQRLVFGNEIAPVVAATLPEGGAA